LATLAVYFYLTAKNAKNRKGFFIYYFLFFASLGDLGGLFLFNRKERKESQRFFYLLFSFLGVSWRPWRFIFI
jgi:hypothetical protein